MIDKITLKNFKAFKSLDALTVKPITVISGTNSCGKSSILQSILLMKQTIESQNPNQTILLNGRLVHLGIFQNIVYKKNIGNIVELTFRYKFRKDDIYRSSVFGRRIPVNFLLRDLIPKLPEITRRNKNVEYLLEYSIKLEQTSTNGNKSNFTRTLLVKECSYCLDAYDGKKMILEGPETVFKRNNDDKYAYSAIWRNIHHRFKHEEFPSSGTEDNVRLEFSNLFPEVIELRDRKKQIGGIFVGFYRVNELLRQILRGYSYIGPLREEPARRYIFEDEIIEIGIKGENAAYIYLSEQDKKIKNHYFLNSATDSFEIDKTQIKLKDAVTRWLNIMGISDFTAEAQNEIIQLMLNSNEYDDTKINIADVGFGISQIFPIVLEGLRMNPSQTLVLEQPEIHLHPNLQMLLADYLLSLAISGKKIIVETHSDHIINRLVRRIVEDEKHNFKDIVGIYFIKPSESGSQYEEVSIDESLGITNWPVGFFDQTASEQEKIIKAGLKKRLSKRSEEANDS